jgi:AcrR family transcriptional regulator
MSPGRDRGAVANPGIAENRAIETRPFFRTPEDLRVHRQQLYRRAARVFRRHGYKGATLKELSAACGLSVPALYRYFPSKRDLALYPLSAANRPGRECFRRASGDPLVQLRVWLDHAAWERADFLLALRLGAEIADGRGITDEHMETFRFHTGLVAEMLGAAAPGLGERRARELTESLLAMSLGTDAAGIDWPPTTAWARFVRRWPLTSLAREQSGLTCARSCPRTTRIRCTVRARSNLHPMPLFSISAKFT